MKDINLYKLTNDNFHPSYILSEDDMTLMVKVSLVNLDPVKKTYAIVVSGADDYSLVTYFYNYYDAIQFLSTRILPMEYLNKKELKTLGFVES